MVVVRRMQKDGSRYFGPYADVQAVRQTVRFLQRLFPIRSCKREIGPEGTGERPCLNYHIKRCSAPCARKIGQEEYRRMIDEMMLVLEGRHEKLLQELTQRMQAAAEALRFEEAARLRDQIQSLTTVVERQKIVSLDNIDQDIIGYARVEDLACVQVFFVRGGKIIGSEHFFLDAPVGDEGREILTAFVQQYYATASFVPKELLLPEALAEEEVITQWLSGLKGARVYLRVPKRGEKKRLVEMVEKNAGLVLQERLTRQERERNRRRQGLEELQSLLGLAELPRRIEAFDISNIQGAEAVGSMVVFEDGAPAQQEYRRFKIRSKSTPDDYTMMRELVYRRFARGLKEQEAGGEADFAQMPQLVLIDGGKGQLNAASQVLTELGIENIFMLSLAERFEDVYVEGRRDPISIPRNSNGLHILQHLRDEAHRFALAYHRQLRSRRTTHSLLDEIPGVGPKRKKQLIRHFGSVQAVREATLEQLKGVPGLPASVAERIYQGMNVE